MDRLDYIEDNDPKYLEQLFQEAVAQGIKEYELYLSKADVKSILSHENTEPNSALKKAAKEYNMREERDCY